MLQTFEDVPKVLENNRTLLGPGWACVDSLDDLDPDEFEDEEDEDIYVTMDLGTTINSRSLIGDGQYQLIGMDTPLPFLKIGNNIFQGEVTPLIGTEVILGLIRKENDPQRPSHPPVHCTNHRITFRGVDMIPASEPIQASGSSRHHSSSTSFTATDKKLPDKRPRMMFNPRGIETYLRGENKAKKLRELEKERIKKGGKGKGNDGEEEEEKQGDEDDENEEEDEEEEEEEEEGEGKKERERGEGECGGEEEDDKEDEENKDGIESEDDSMRGIEATLSKSKYTGKSKASNADADADANVEMAENDEEDEDDQSIVGDPLKPASESKLGFSDVTGVPDSGMKNRGGRPKGQTTRMILPISSIADLYALDVHGIGIDRVRLDLAPDADDDIRAAFAEARRGQPGPLTNKQQERLLRGMPMAGPGSRGGRAGGGLGRSSRPSSIGLGTGWIHDIPVQVPSGSGSERGEVSVGYGSTERLVGRVVGGKRVGFKAVKEGEEAGLSNGLLGDHDDDGDDGDEEG